MSRINEVPHFDHPRLAELVEALPPHIVDALPFGAIRLSADGAVQFYSAAERRLSGLGTLPTIGLDFFAKLAPCMDGPGFRGRLQQAQQQGRVDLEFTHIGDFEDRDRELTVRAQSASAGGYWLFLRRQD